MQCVRAHNRAVHLSRFSLELFLTCASQASQCQRCACNSASSAYARASASTDLASAALASHFLISPTMNSTAVGVGQHGRRRGARRQRLVASRQSLSVARRQSLSVVVAVGGATGARPARGGLPPRDPLATATRHSKRGPCAAERVGRTAENGPTLITTRMRMDMHMRTSSPRRDHGHGHAHERRRPSA